MAIALILDKILDMGYEPDELFGKALLTSCPTTPFTYGTRITR